MISQYIDFKNLNLISSHKLCKSVYHICLITVTTTLMGWECLKPFLIMIIKTTNDEQLWYFQSVVIKTITKTVFSRQVFRVETDTLLNIYFCVQDFNCTKCNKTTDICHKKLTVNNRSLRHFTNINGRFLLWINMLCSLLLHRD